MSRLVGNGKHWREVCSKARELGSGLSSVDARKYFENWFIPYQMGNHGKDTGLITGYYEPLLAGSRNPTTRFKVPLYKRPKNLVSVDLGSFSEKWRGNKIIGKVSDARLVPYEERSEIENGSLRGQNLELLWVDDPVDAFFLHVQGSGRIILRDGRSVRVGYAGKNGHPYFAIGRYLVSQGILPKKRVSLTSIDRWLRTHPSEAQSLMNKNKSYIFFRMLKGPGPIGAQGIRLTPGHSLAVDKRYVPLGVPLWLDTVDPLSPGTPLRRLVIAQDTGSAIKGVIRADLFWGAGVKAKEGAGQMKEKGRLHMLLPRSAILED